MRPLTIIESKHGDGSTIAHVQDMSTGQIWRSDNRKRRGKGPFMPGHLPHVSDVRPNRYDHRPRVRSVARDIAVFGKSIVTNEGEQR